MTPLLSTTLRVGFAAALFTLTTAESCADDGGQRNDDNGTCPTTACSAATPDGLLFIATTVGETLFDPYDVKPMAIGGTETIQIATDRSGGGAVAPLALPFDADVDAAGGALLRKTGPTVVVQGAAVATGTATPYLSIVAPDGTLYDRVAIATDAIARADLLVGLDEATVNLNDGLPMLFAPGGLGYVDLDAVATPGLDSVPLVDESLQLTGDGVTQTRWDQFTIGALAPGLHTLTATSGAAAFPVTFEVAAGPDRLALSSELLGPVQVGYDSVVCFAAFAGPRFIHVAWTITGNGVDVHGSPWDGCRWITPRAAGDIVLHVSAGGLTLDQHLTAAAADAGSDHRAAPRPGSRGERSTLAVLRR